MMRLLLLVSSLLLVLAVPSEAQYRRFMGWSDATPGNDVIDPDCGTLPATSTLVVAFEAPAGDLIGVTGYLDFCTVPQTLPEWWRFEEAGSCREGAHSISADFSGGPATYLDPWSTATSTVVDLEYPYGGPTMGRFWFAVQTADSQPVTVQQGETYYAFKLVFDNPSVGCGGCEVPTCFVLNGLVVQHSGGLAYTDMDYTNWAAWHTKPDCPFVVQNHGVSWGTVKAIYR